jgi:hypothetical protein
MLLKIRIGGHSGGETPVEKSPNVNRSVTAIR